MNESAPAHPAIAFVVAVGAGGEIGHRGAMPWHLPADLKHFKTATMGHTLLMGRRTFESIGRALPGRENFIVSRDPEFRAAGCRIFKTIDAAVDAAPRERPLMVIGGATLFEALLPLAQTVHLTRIDSRFDADTYFPELDMDEWQEVAREDHAADERNVYAYSFITLVRKVPTW
ncbi:MAG TPA: dihydrofolate reductase [Gammaproteobacteria bacterium]|nr:dihydrofolate reductase [Gammaproteobacteria bacterium]